MRTQKASGPDAQTRVGPLTQGAVLTASGERSSRDDGSASAAGTRDFPERPCKPINPNDIIGKTDDIKSLATPRRLLAS
jgi:hypothetical protein